MPQSERKVKPHRAHATAGQERPRPAPSIDTD
jgi:hypothetical protein